jgi:oxygen-independent coproporphyrinogen III oxidase
MTPHACKRICDEVSLAPARALYVHVPFCLRKCRYCDFYSRSYDPLAAEAYVEAARLELRLGEPHLRTPLASVYIGGGTPTALALPLLERLLSAVRPLTDRQTEFTVEANPGTLSAPVAASLAELGVNRVSLGVQSFQAAELRMLGRIHTAQEAADALRVLRSAGIENLGLDLIYGIPGQTLTSWRESLGAAAGLQPEHLSVYGLSFEERTPLHEELQRGQVRAMDEETQRECYFEAIEWFQRSGLEHYEISNFARPGRRSRHNLTYWRNQTYLGIGPAAASYVQGTRRTNAPDLEAYVLALRAGQAAPCIEEQLPLPMVMAETLMLGLRLREGVDRREFAARFGQDPLAAFPASLGRYLDLGAIQTTELHIRIARESLFVSDTVLADIVAEAQDMGR